MIFLKGVLGGVGAVVLMWIAIVALYLWRMSALHKRQGATGLVATAGGWTYLLHMPSVVILLTIAFGIGLYLTTRFAA